MERENLGPRGERPSEEDWNEVLRRGRFEDRSLAAAIGSLLLIAAIAWLLQAGAPVSVFVPVLVALFMIAFVATCAWAVGNVRTSRALDRLEAAAHIAKIHQPLWKYLLAVDLGLSAGAAYWLASDPIRRWLWMGWVLASIGVSFWLQRRHRRVRSHVRR
jgi:hypothetical protein